MFKFNLVSQNVNLDFLKVKNLAFLFSIALIILTVFFILYKGLNFGIDFKGGVLIELRDKSNSSVQLSEFRKKAELLNVGEISVQKFGKETDVLLRIQKQQGDERKQILLIEKVKNTFEKDFEIRRTEFVGPVVGDELKEAGLTAVILSLFLIMLYIWFRFEWQFAIASIIALIHDVVSTIGLFSIFSLEFNLSIVAAILTTAGYSINDTVVVFDRVRENLRKYKSKEHYFIYNKSINETLSRTLMTSVTTLIALVIIYFFGGAVLADFALAMIWGVIIGTYSSIFIAVSFLTFFKIYKGEKKENSKHIPKK